MEWVNASPGVEGRVRVGEGYAGFYISIARG